MTNDGLPEPAAWCWEQYGRANEYCSENEWFWCYDSTKPDESDSVTVRGEVPLYTADQLRAAIEQERERCAKIAEAEEVDAAGTGNDADAAYNLACEHIASAIRSGVKP